MGGQRLFARRGCARQTAIAIAGVVALASASCRRVRELDPIRADDAGPNVPPAASETEVGGGTELQPTSAPLEPLESTPAIVPLGVPGMPEAVLSVPIGATGPRPVVVATHGLWDFPEGLCDNWRWIVGNRAWVLCPRGEMRPDKTFRYRSGPALAREIDEGVRALEERYPGYVDPGPRLYTGFSLGAILGAWIIKHDPEHYPRAILTEGGEDKFDAASAAAYARGGGQRVLFACGLAFRVAGATRAAKVLEHAGVPSRVVLGKLPDAGQFIHWYNGPVAEETREQLPWLLEGDGRWGM
jgi:hypothetical protein